MAHFITIASADGFELLIGLIIIAASIISQLISAKRQKAKNVIITSQEGDEPLSPEIELRKFLESLSNQETSSEKTENIVEEVKELPRQAQEEEKAIQYYVKAEELPQPAPTKKAPELSSKAVAQSDIFQKSFTNIAAEKKANEEAPLFVRQPVQHLHAHEPAKEHKHKTITVSTLFPALREKKSEKRTLLLQKAFLMHEVFGPPIGFRRGNDIYSVPGIKNPYSP